jgi:hypothetical protein
MKNVNKRQAEAGAIDNNFMCLLSLRVGKSTSFVRFLFARRFAEDARRISRTEPFATNALAPTTCLVSRALQFLTEAALKKSLAPVFSPLSTVCLKAQAGGQLIFLRDAAR